MGVEGIPGRPVDSDLSVVYLVVYNKVKYNFVQYDNKGILFGISLIFEFRDDLDNSFLFQNFFK